jgi:hypothetical protein
MNYNNRLFCTFSSLENIEEVINSIRSKYNILYNKMFVLDIKGNNECIITYNIDYNNIDCIPEDTILVHRKKETNTLYTINALNELIKTLNEGYLDNEFPINWGDYHNQILFTQEGQLKLLNTKINRIIEL